MSASATPRKSAPRKSVNAGPTPPKGTTDFTWNIDGETITFPPMDLTYGLIEDMSEMNELQQMVRIFKEFLSAEDRALIRPLGYSELRKIMEAWGEHTGASLGES